MLLWKICWVFVGYILGPNQSISTQHSPAYTTSHLSVVVGSCVTMNSGKTHQHYFVFELVYKQGLQQWSTFLVNCDFPTHYTAAKKLHQFPALQQTHISFITKWLEEHTCFIDSLKYKVPNKVKRESSTESNDSRVKSLSHWKMLHLMSVILCLFQNHK